MENRAERWCSAFFVPVNLSFSFLLINFVASFFGWRQCVADGQSGVWLFL